MLKERAETRAAEATPEKKKTTSGSRNRQGVIETMMKSIVRSLGSSLGRELSRGVLGSILKG